MCYLIFLVNMHGLFFWKIEKVLQLLMFSKKYESSCKANKMWVDKGTEFYNRSMKSWLEKNAIEIYSIHKEGKSVVAERFIRTLKNKIYK